MTTRHDTPAGNGGVKDTNHTSRSDGTSGGAPDALLELRGISKFYGQVQALHDVSFTIGRGETVGLFGDNGAGKSTLIKIMAGVEQADAGEIFWEGKSVPLGSRRASAALGIEPIYQDGALCESMPIWRNVFLGREDTVRGGFLRAKSMRATASTILRSVIEIGAHIDPERLVGELSGGQRQAVAIARAVHFKRALLLLDEPTSALAVRETEALLSYVRRLRDEGVSSVLITHNLHQAYQVCERFIVMSRGQVSMDARLGEISLADLTEHVIAQ